MEEIKRGPGRPPGSPNLPKPPPLSVAQREALTQKFADEYAEALVTRTLAQERVRGIKSLARIKLGAAGFHEIESKLERAKTHEAEVPPADGAAAEANEAGSQA